MKLMIFVLLMALSTFVVVANEGEPVFTVDMYNKKSDELIKEHIYKNKMSGNIEAYYFVFDYMGKGYLKLDTDIIIQIKNYEDLKSDSYTLSFSAKMGRFNEKKEWNFQKKDIFKNNEGNGIVIRKLSLEKGKYEDVKIILQGKSGDTAAITIPEYNTLSLGDHKTKLGSLFLTSSLNELRNQMFYRRYYVVEPNIIAYFEKSKTFGFYVEYYHLKTDALYGEGNYEITYRIINAIVDKVIFEDTIKQKDVKSSGVVVVPPVDLSGVLAGVYKLEISFKDSATDIVNKREAYFVLADNEKKEDK